ncbi:hypothetical protein SAMN02910289_00651 [Lachnospiraceae bacterium RM5]|nr:hypothetical protein SAMN02910289_00651 [Lachnospiraceae bacterium RM5]
MQNANYLIEVIQWCNENVGFATIVLSALTLLVSIIAVIVSIRTARLPYKKMIKIEAGSYITTDGASGLHVTAINCGNIDFTINSMGFITKDKQLMVNLRSTNQYPFRLIIGEQLSEYFANEAPAIQSLKANQRIYAYVKDSEGKIYRKKMKSK